MAIVSYNGWPLGFSNSSFDNKTNTEMYNQSCSQLQNMMIESSGAIRTRFGSEAIQIYDTDALMCFNIKRYALVMYSDTNASIDIDIYQGTTLLKSLQMSVTTTSSIADILRQRKVKSYVNKNQIIFVTGVCKPFFVEIDESTIPIKATVQDFHFSGIPTYDYTQGAYKDNLFAFYLTEVEEGKTANLFVNNVTSSAWDGFNANYIGGVFQAAGDKDSDNIGQALITDIAQVTYNNKPMIYAEVKIITAFAKNGTTPTATPYPAPINQYVGGPFQGSVYLAEQAFSDDRGYPTDVCIEKDRLTLIGNQDVVFQSRIASYKDFATIYGDEDGALEYSIGSNYPIQNIIPKKGLQIFTEKSEYATPVLSTSGAVTPNSLQPQLTSSNGSLLTTPVISNNTTFYAHSNGRNVDAFAYDAATDCHVAKNITMLSSDLINFPVSISSWDASNTFDYKILFVANKLNETENTSFNDATLIHLNSSAEYPGSSSFTFLDRYTKIDKFDYRNFGFINSSTVCDQDLYFSFSYQSPLPSDINRTILFRASFESFLDATFEDTIDIDKKIILTTPMVQILNNSYEAGNLNNYIYVLVDDEYIKLDVQKEPDQNFSESSSHDAHVQKHRPTDNYGSDDEILVKAIALGGSREREAFVKFDVDVMGNVDQGLSLNFVDSNLGNTPEDHVYEFSVYSCNDFDESNLTYDNKPERLQYLGSFDLVGKGLGEKIFKSNRLSSAMKNSYENDLPLCLNIIRNTEVTPNDPTVDYVHSFASKEHATVVGPALKSKQVTLFVQDERLDPGHKIYKYGIEFTQKFETKNIAPFSQGASTENVIKRPYSALVSYVNSGTFKINGEDVIQRELPYLLDNITPPKTEVYEVHFDTQYSRYSTINITKNTPGFLNVTSMDVGLNI